MEIYVQRLKKFRMSPAPRAMLYHYVSTRTVLGNSSLIIRLSMSKM